MQQRDIFPPKPSLELGKYRHYKGGEYEVTALACDEETHEWRVIYKPLYEHQDLPDTWDRRADVFLESVMVDGVVRPRFEKI